MERETFTGRTLRRAGGVQVREVRGDLRERKREGGRGKGEEEKR